MLSSTLTIRQWQYEILNEVLNEVLNKILNEVLYQRRFLDNRMFSVTQPCGIDER